MIEPFVLIEGALANGACDMVVNALDKLERSPGRTAGGMNAEVRNVEQVTVQTFTGLFATVRDDLTYRMRHANSHFGFSAAGAPIPRL